MEILVLEVGGRRVGVPSAAVREVIRAVAVTPLPGAPPVIAGVIDVRGTLVPVLDLRARLGLVPRGIAPHEEWVLVEAGARRVALRADHAVALHQVEDTRVEDVRAAVPAERWLTGAARLADGLVLIHDPEAFLSRSEEASLAGALAELADRAGGEAE